MSPCGNLSAYKKGCRCAACKKAYRTNRRLRSEKRILSDAQGMRRRHIKKKYGLSLDDYDKMFSEQRGLCLICKKPQKPVGFNLSIDHNHKTNRVRGLLCHKCNGSLGWYEIYSSEIVEYLLFTQGFGDC